MSLKKMGWAQMGLIHRLFLAQRSQKIGSGQYDNDTDPSSLSFLRGSGMSCGKSSGGMVEVEEDEGTFGFGLEILTLDFDFLGEDD